MTATATDWAGHGVEMDVVNGKRMGLESTYGTRRSQKVINHEGDMVRIRQESMVVGRPYGFVYDHVPVVAIKRDNGTVDFYHIPVK